MSGFFPTLWRRDGFSQMFSLVSNVPVIMTKVAITLHCTVGDHIFIFIFMCRRAYFLAIEITFFIRDFSHISPSLCYLHDIKLKWLHTNWRIKLNFKYLWGKKKNSKATLISNTVFTTTINITPSNMTERKNLLYRLVI